MKTGKCICCRQEMELNREHAIPDSLLQKGTVGWVIHKLCQTCNSRLGKLDNALSKRSHIAFLWNTIQTELGQKNKGLHDSIFRKRADEVNPVRVPFPDPLYDNLIILHERSDSDSHTLDFVYRFSALQPQMILILYQEGQTNRDIIAENFDKFHTSSSMDKISNYDPQENVFCFFGNTYVFPPEATWHFLKNINDFKSKYMTDYPRTRYDLRVVYPEARNSWNKFNEFLNAFKGEERGFIEEDKSLTTGVFKGRIQIIPDPEAEQTIARAIAKVAFHCFLYHNPKYTGHEPMFERIKDFIYNGNGTPTDFVMSAKDIEMENLVYDTAEHRHYIRFFVKDDSIGCVIDFFTGLLVEPFSYNVILAGDPDNTHPQCDRVEYVPFYVHPKSPIKRRIMPRSEIGIIHKPRWSEGILWFPKRRR